VLGQHRSTQRKVPDGRADEDALTADIIALASQHGRYGYRRITALLRDAGWVVNVKRVERRAFVRHWSEDNGERRREGLKVPQKQPKRGRLWLAEAKIVIESWRWHYNTKRPHSSLGYRPPAPEGISWPASQSGPASPATPAVAPRPVMHQD
jgi:transposase InsO family protein